MEECNQRKWSVCNWFGIIIPCSATYFLEVGARVSLKVATRVFFRCKKPVKLENWEARIRELRIREAEECDQEDWSVSEISGIITPCSGTYHLEVGIAVVCRCSSK